VERRTSPSRFRVDIDELERVAYFYLWNLCGQMVGYQHYRPDADKQRKNHPKEGRYFTYRTPDTYGVWGLESLTLREDVLFVVEGIFKAVPFHLAGYPAIAVISNNPKPLRNFLYILSKSRRIVFVGDNDDGGSATRSMGYEIVFPPGDVKDVDEVPQEEFEEWVRSIAG
jgi:hypothetical protein